MSKSKNVQIEDSSTSKRKGRSKRKRGGNTVRRAQHVDTDENGNAILPISLGVMTLHNLGTVVYDRDTFHNERYIFPVGYTLTRRYFSMVKSDVYVNYRCTVKDGGKAPIFEVTPEDAVDKKTSATSPTGAWISIVKAVNEMRNKDHSNSASGPDYFGFTSSTIAKLIQDLPNAKKCKNYKWQKFETTSGRSLKKAALTKTVVKKEKEEKKDNQENSMSIDEKKLVKPKEEEDVEVEDTEEIIEDSQDNIQEETETTHEDEDEEMDEIEEDEDDGDGDEDKGKSPEKDASSKNKNVEKKNDAEDTVDEDDEEDEIEDSAISDSDNHTKTSAVVDIQITSEDDN